MINFHVAIGPDGIILKSITIYIYTHGHAKTKFTPNKKTVKIINTLTLETLIFQLRMKCLAV